jgi:membrane-associated phospholipid phosphatase
VGQAAIIGLIISSAYKFFTGRMQPPRLLAISTPDISAGFRFGLFRGGVFWGWPSSHTTVAFAAAVALFTLYPENKTVKILALLVAFYIGIGVSVSIHWFSDFAAGVIIGSVIGLVVGRAFRERNRVSTVT